MIIKFVDAIDLLCFITTISQSTRKVKMRLPKKSFHPLLLSPMLITLNECTNKMLGYKRKIVIGASPEKKESLNEARILVRLVKDDWINTAKTTPAILTKNSTTGTELLPERTTFYSFKHKLMLEKLKALEEFTPENL